jgi:hypothetical protein
MRDDGEGVDWSIIAEALLKAGFHALDRMPRDRRVYTLLRRVEIGATNRLSILVFETYTETGPPPPRPPLIRWKCRKRISATWRNRQGRPLSTALLFRRLLQPVEIVGKAERPLCQSLLKLDQACLSDTLLP